MRFFFHEFLLSDFVRLYLKYVCDQNISGKICSNVMFMIWGYSGKQFNHVSNNCANIAKIESSTITFRFALQIELYVYFLLFSIYC